MVVGIRKLAMNVGVLPVTIVCILVVDAMELDVINVLRYIVVRVVPSCIR